MICEINLDGERGEHEELTRRNGQFEIEEFRKLGNLSGFHSSVFAFPSFPPPSPFSSLRICAFDEGKFLFLLLLERWSFFTGMTAEERERSVII